MHGYPELTMATPYDHFHTYMRAFKLGAAGGLISKWHQDAQDHQDASIRDAWHQGYAAGREARNTAVEGATKLYGYTPSILRLADAPDEEAS